MRNEKASGVKIKGLYIIGVHLELFRMKLMGLPRYNRLKEYCIEIVFQNGDEEIHRASHHVPFVDLFLRGTQNFQVIHYS